MSSPRTMHGPGSTPLRGKRWVYMSPYRGFSHVLRSRLTPITRCGRRPHCCTAGSRRTSISLRYRVMLCHRSQYHSCILLYPKSHVRRSCPVGAGVCSYALLPASVLSYCNGLTRDRSANGEPAHDSPVLSSYPVATVSCTTKLPIGSWRMTLRQLQTSNRSASLIDTLLHSTSIKHYPSDR